MTYCFLSRRPSYARALMLRTLCAAMPTLLPYVAQADTSLGHTTLAPVTVQAGAAAMLDEPASVGSSLPLSLRQIPASVDVIDREQLEARGDTSVIQAITRAPGLSEMGHPGNGGSSLSARGFTDTTSVMRLYDGVRQYGGVGLTFPFDTWSIERIEVLRGPASVIHGDGAMGGVINIIPKRPTRGPVEHEAQLSVGTEHSARLGLGSGGALSDTLSYRVDASADRSNGWVDQGKTRNQAVSAALQWDPTPDWMFRLSHSYGHQQPMKYFGAPLVDGEFREDLRKKNYNVADGIIDYRDNWTEMAAQWRPNNRLTLSSKLYYIDSQRHYRNAEYADYNAATGLVDRPGNTEILHDQTQLGNTTQLVLDGMLFQRKNQFSIGFDINKSRFKHTNNTYVGTNTSVDLYDPVPGEFYSHIPTLPRYRSTATQYALFAENRLAISDAWSVLGGLRYDHARLARQDLITATQDYRRNYSHVGWRVGTVYDLSQDFSIYAQYAKAADPVSSALTQSAANSAFELSTGRQIEVGLKQSFLDGQGEWTLAAYHIVKKNLLTRDPQNPSERLQVGQQSSKGLEATLALTLARDWRIEANAAVLRARYDDFTDNDRGLAVSRKGNRPPNVPERLANLWLSWRFQPDWTASAGLRYVGKRYADSANKLEMPGYTTVDLSLQWQPIPSTTVYARAFNILDKHYAITSYYTPTQWLHGPGRRFEISVHQRF